MASASDIESVRSYTNESTDDNYDDDKLGSYIDELGVAGATHRVWVEKSARYAELVNTTEGGVSESFSDLFKHAERMRAYWASVTSLEDHPPRVGTRIRSIQRG